MLYIGKMAKRKRTSVVWEFFELKDETIGDIKVKKAVYKLCEGLTLAYAGGSSNLLSHLEVKHPIDYAKTGRGESSTTMKQSTLSSFRTKVCPPDRANTITTLITEFVCRDLNIRLLVC